MHIDADVIRSGRVWLTRVDAHAHPQLDTTGPLGVTERALSFSCRGERVVGPREGYEKRVALGTDLVALVPRESISQQAAVLLQNLRIRPRPELLKQPRGALNIREQERDGPD